MSRQNPDSDIPRDELIAAAILLLPKGIPRNIFGLPVQQDDICFDVISWIEDKRAVAVEELLFWEWCRNSPNFVAFKVTESFYSLDQAKRLKDSVRSLYGHHVLLEKAKLETPAMHPCGDGVRE